MSINVPTPPIMSGNSDQQLAKLSSYLFRLSEMLTVSLNSLNQSNFDGAVELAASSGKKASEIDADSSSYNDLRSLIVNTSKAVNSEIDALQFQLDSQYSALSEDWGTFQENITSTITATASAVVQSYGYDAEIETLQELAAGFSAYQVSTEGYIRSGFIDYDENNVPIIGIAIGQGLTSTSVTIDGETYEHFDSTQSCAFYTADKVSFRINGQEVAYVSNSKLYIADVEITGSAVIGDWLISKSNGLSVKWIGA